METQSENLVLLDVILPAVDLIVFPQTSDYIWKRNHEEVRLSSVVQMAPKLTKKRNIYKYRERNLFVFIT